MSKCDLCCVFWSKTLKRKLLPPGLFSFNFFFPLKEPGCGDPISKRPSAAIPCDTVGAPKERLDFGSTIGKQSASNLKKKKKKNTLHGYVNKKLKKKNCV